MAENIGRLVANDVKQFVHDLQEGKQLPRLVEYKKDADGVKIRRMTGFYQVLLDEAGDVKKRQGSHTIAFATYGRALNWLIQGLSPEEVRKKLDQDFHLEIKLSCFFNMAITTMGEEGTPSVERLGYIFEGVDGRANNEKILPGLDDLYHQMQNSEDSTLDMGILDYLNRVVYIYQYFPSATFYMGSAASLTEASRIRGALCQLDKVMCGGNASSDGGLYRNEDIKREMKNVFDGAANFKLLEKYSVYALLVLVLQIYRFSYPFGVKQLLVFESSQDGVNDLINFIMDVLSLNKDSLKTRDMMKVALRCIRTERDYYKQHGHKSIVSMVGNICASLEEAKRKHEIQGVVLQSGKITFV